MVSVEVLGCKSQSQKKKLCHASALLKCSMPVQSFSHDGWFGFSSCRPNSPCSLYTELRPPKNSCELNFESQVSVLHMTVVRSTKSTISGC